VKATSRYDSYRSVQLATHIAQGHRPAQCAAAAAARHGSQPSHASASNADRPTHVHDRDGEMDGPPTRPAGLPGGFSGRRVTRPPCNFASKRATTTNANGFRPVTYGSRPGRRVMQSAHSPADRRRLFPVDAELHSRRCSRLRSRCRRRRVHVEATTPELV